MTLPCCTRISFCQESLFVWFLLFVSFSVFVCRFVFLPLLFVCLFAATGDASLSLFVRIPCLFVFSSSINFCFFLSVFVFLFIYLYVFQDSVCFVLFCFVSSSPPTCHPSHLLLSSMVLCLSVGVLCLCVSCFCVCVFLLHCCRINDKNCEFASDDDFLLISNHFHLASCEYFAFL